MTVWIGPATEEHARALAPRMRAADVAEVRASGGRGPLEALLRALDASSVARVALFDAEVACLWGVAPLRRSHLAGRVGAAWLLTGDLVERYPLAFWRRCQVELRELLEGYDVLVNAIDARHLQALRWARRLGFHLEGAAPFGAEGLPFVGFTVRKEDLACASR